MISFPSFFGCGSRNLNENRPDRNSHYRRNCLAVSAIALATGASLYAALWKAEAASLIITTVASTVAAHLIPIALAVTACALIIICACCLKGPKEKSFNPSIPSSPSSTPSLPIVRSPLPSSVSETAPPSDVDEANTLSRDQVKLITETIAKIESEIKKRSLSDFPTLYELSFQTDRSPNLSPLLTSSSKNPLIARLKAATEKLFFHARTYESIDTAHRNLHRILQGIDWTPIDASALERFPIDEQFERLLLGRKIDPTAGAFQAWEGMVRGYSSEGVLWYTKVITLQINQKALSALEQLADTLSHAQAFKKQCSAYLKPKDSNLIALSKAIESLTSHITTCKVANEAIATLLKERWEGRAAPGEAHVRSFATLRSTLANLSKSGCAHLQLKEEMQKVSTYILTRYAEALETDRLKMGAEDRKLLAAHIETAKQVRTAFKYEACEKFEQALKAAEAHLKTCEEANVRLAEPELYKLLLTKILPALKEDTQASADFKVKAQEIAKRQFEAMKEGLKKQITETRYSHVCSVDTLISKSQEMLRNYRVVEESVRAAFETFLNRAIDHSRGCHSAINEIDRVQRQLLANYLTPTVYKGLAETYNKLLESMQAGAAQRELTDQWQTFHLMEKFYKIFLIIQASKDTLPKNSQELVSFKKSLEEQLRSLKKLDFGQLNEPLKGRLKEHLEKQRSEIIHLAEADLNAKAEAVNKLDECRSHILQMADCPQTPHAGNLTTTIIRAELVIQRALVYFSEYQREIEGKRKAGDRMASAPFTQEVLEQINRTIETRKVASALSSPRTAQATCTVSPEDTALFKSILSGSSLGWMTSFKVQAIQVNVAIGKQMHAFLKEGTGDSSKIFGLLVAMQKTYPSVWEYMIQDEDMTWLLRAFYKQALCLPSTPLRPMLTLFGRMDWAGGQPLTNMTKTVSDVISHMKAVTDQFGNDALIYGLHHLYTTLFEKISDSAPTVETSKLPFLLQMLTLLLATKELSILEALSRKLNERNPLNRAIGVLSGSLPSSLWHKSTAAAKAAPREGVKFVLEDAKKTSFSKLCRETIETERKSLDALKRPMQLQLNEAELKELEARKFTKSDIAEVRKFFVELSGLTEAGETACASLNEHMEGYLKKIGEVKDLAKFFEDLIEFFCSEQMRCYASRMARFAESISRIAIFQEGGKFDQLLADPPEFLRTKIVAMNFTGGMLTTRALISEAFQRPPRWELLMNQFCILFSAPDDVRKRLMEAAKFGAQAAYALLALNELDFSRA